MHLSNKKYTINKMIFSSYSTLINVFNRKNEENPGYLLIEWHYYDSLLIYVNRHTFILINNHKYPVGISAYK